MNVLRNVEQHMDVVYLRSARSEPPAAAITDRREALFDATPLRVVESNAHVSLPEPGTRFSLEVGRQERRAWRVVRPVDRRPIGAVKASAVGSEGDVPRSHDAGILSPSSSGVEDDPARSWLAC
jgi:hypothetical protein